MALEEGGADGAHQVLLPASLGAVRMLSPGLKPRSSSGLRKRRSCSTRSRVIWRFMAAASIGTMATAGALHQRRGQQGQRLLGDPRLRFGAALGLAQLGDHLAQVAVGLQAGDVLVGRHQLQGRQVGLQVARPRLGAADRGLQPLPGPPGRCAP